MRLVEVVKKAARKMRAMELRLTSGRDPEMGAELLENIFWIALVLLAIVLLLPALRNILLTNLQNLISALGG